MDPLPAYPPANPQNRSRGGGLLKVAEMSALHADGSPDAECASSATFSSARGRERGVARGSGWGPKPGEPRDEIIWARPAARRKRNEIKTATIISFALLFSSWSRGRFRAHRSLQRRCNHTVLTTEVSPIPSCNRGSRRGPGREEQALPLPPGRLNLSPHGPRARAPASCPWVLRLFINKKI